MRGSRISRPAEEIGADRVAAAEAGMEVRGRRQTSSRISRPAEEIEADRVAAAEAGMELRGRRQTSSRISRPEEEIEEDRVAAAEAGMEVRDRRQTSSRISRLAEEIEVDTQAAAEADTEVWGKEGLTMVQAGPVPITHRQRKGEMHRPHRVTRCPLPCRSSRGNLACKFKIYSLTPPCP